MYLTIFNMSFCNKINAMNELFPKLAILPRAVDLVIRGLASRLD